MGEGKGVGNRVLRSSLVLGDSEWGRGVGERGGGKVRGLRLVHLGELWRRAGVCCLWGLRALQECHIVEAYGRWIFIVENGCRALYMREREKDKRRCLILIPDSPYR